MLSFLGCFLLGALLATGTCLQCESCFSLGTICNGTLTDCSAGEDTCIVNLREILQPPAVSKVITKGCGTSKVCKAGLNEINVGNGVQLRARRICCTGDACERAPPPVLPPLDNKPNGLQCPGCIGIFSADCYGNPVDCTGLQSKCIDISGSVTGYQKVEIALKGCAVEAACEIFHKGFNSYEGVSVYLDKAECHPAPTKAP
uniref:UPAR/Ly6 domain-containing protein n=1 Tax=Salvator merianae TaxID=96440 RepID=A0A8D0B7Z7_SALMN